MYIAGSPLRAAESDLEVVAHLQGVVLAHESFHHRNALEGRVGHRAVNGLYFNGGGRVTNFVLRKGGDFLEISKPYLGSNKIEVYFERPLDISQN